MKAIVWGAGGTAKEFFLRKIMNYKYDVVCLVDNNSDLWGKKRFGYDIVSPQDISDKNFDIIILCSVYYEEIKRQLKDLNIESEKIITYQDIDNEICKCIVEKYQGSKDIEVMDTIKEFMKGSSSILGAYNPPFAIFSEVHRDDDGWPYILFEGKKMYYPLKHIFALKNGKEVVADIMYEQGEESPHRYLPKGYSMPNDAVIVDAGVCEGNFALRFADTAKKIYLIEADVEWMEALKRTFAPYNNKVEYINKFLSGRDNSREITLDNIVKGHLDFLKMDIEGAEVDALLGAKRVLTANNVQCAVCSYHRQYDERYIQHILQSYGYNTETSKGFIFFPYDENLVVTHDYLRRGVVYGSK